MLSFGGGMLGVVLGRFGGNAWLSRSIPHQLSAALVLPAQNVSIDGFCVVVEGCGVLVSQCAHFGEDRVFLHVSLPHELGGRAGIRRLEAVLPTDALDGLGFPDAAVDRVPNAWK
jgi:hypothetical protein